MAKRAGWIPAWARTLDRMIAVDLRVDVWCLRCGECRRVDLAALRERVGGEYSLVNRRCRCRLTPGCQGWNKFRYMHGVMRPLVEEDVWHRWLFDRG
jgi:hypothetical protein